MERLRREVLWSGETASTVLVHQGRCAFGQHMARLTLAVLQMSDEPRGRPVSLANACRH